MQFLMEIDAGFIEILFKEQQYQLSVADSRAESDDGTSMVCVPAVTVPVEIKRLVKIALIFIMYPLLLSLSGVLSCMCPRR
ncbi:MAG: hypothetical protein CMJ36_04380 [Phycisphaerae bacterium]|nr:hypothetical protein [Phycisphaerae bacterium]